MENMYVIELDSIKRNSYYGYGAGVQIVGRARCGEFESVGFGSNLKKVAKMMVASGIDPEVMVKVVRGTTLVFYPAKLAVWAK